MLDEITRIATDAIEVADKDNDPYFTIGYLTGALRSIVREIEKHQKNERSLYVFTGFSPDYSGGLAFAIAGSEQDARIMIEDSRGYEVNEWGKLSVHAIDSPVSYSVSGGG